MSGEYREESYRKKALALAVQLRSATQNFLDSHK